MNCLDRDRGCAVVVGPDQYVAKVLPLEAFQEIAGFLQALVV